MIVKSTPFSGPPDGTYICPGCGYYPQNRVLKAYARHLDGMPHPSKRYKGKTLGPFPSHNQLVGNHKGKSGWLYRRFRDWSIEQFSRGWAHSESCPGNLEWASWSLGETPKQTEYFRRVFITRNIGKGKRAFDDHNSFGGLKGLIDALVCVGVLTDDSPRYCKIYVKQIKCLHSCECADILIQDAAHAERAR